MHTSGQAAKSGSGGSSSKSSNGGSVGQKRKADIVLMAQPTTSHTTLPATNHTAIATEPPTDLNNANKGMQLLQKYGWEKGTAIGKSGEKANEPIKVSRIVDRAGIGCNTTGASRSTNSNNSAHVIDDELDSEKTKAWKRMMARFAEPR